MKRTLLIILGSFFATAAVIKAAPGLAEPASDVHVTIVRTADLDLSTEAGLRQLDHRLANAATEACGSAADVDLSGRNQVRQCRHDVLARAHERVDALLASTKSDAILTVSAK